jgi:hypothetical protein
MGRWRAIGKSESVHAFQTLMVLAATVHENFIFALEQLYQLSRLSQFCQLKDIIDFNELTLMALKPPLVPGTGF